MTVQARPLPSPPRSSSAMQFARFVAVGATNTALSFVVYVALVAAGMPYLAAGAVAFAVGAANGFVLNGRWTFRTRGSAARYVVVQIGGLALTTGRLRLLVDTGAGRIGGYLVAIPLVTVATFVANRTWAFA